MKNLQSYLKFMLLAFAAVFTIGCVHDENYNTPDGTAATYQCADLTATLSLAQVKALYTKSAVYTFPAESKDIVEGYVSSSDETGNIYKTIYIQDKLENPTEGFTIAVDAVSTYTNFPQGSKVYIKLAGLTIGEYGGLIQLGKLDGTETRPLEVSRISEKILPNTIIRSCGNRETIVPKVMTLNELGSAADQYLGVLVKVKNAEFDQFVLCMQYAPEGKTVDRRIIDPTKGSVSTRVVRNSGYASFASKKMPTGNGDFVGILSKFNAVYQFYIVRDSDLKMETFPRLDAITEAPCAADPKAQNKTVAEVKQMLTGSLTQITGNYNVTAKVTANDETGNLYKYFYIEDATGGIRVNIDMPDLFLDNRFQVGRMVTINLKNLYIGAVNGELQLGGLYNGTLGRVTRPDVYKHFFAVDTPITNIVPTEKTLTNLTPQDVGRWIKLKDLQFIDADLHKTYAVGTMATNRTLQDCAGKTILLRTSGYADFGTRDFPLKANAVEVDPGRGDVYAILSVYNGIYQLWITKLRDIDLDKPRCDGTLPPKENYSSIFKDEFKNLSKWTAINVSGAATWTTTTFGNPGPSALMDGKRLANEDWLVLANPVSLAGYSDAALSFETDARYEGKSIEVLVTESYTGNPSTSTWTKLNPVLDTDLAAFGGWVGSGNVSLKQYAGKSVVVAFKYTSVSGASTIWEIDNFQIKGIK